MNNKEIFQGVLHSLGINSNSELLQPWSYLFPQGFPRIVNTNSMEYNFFTKNNQDILLKMISVALSLFSTSDSIVFIPVFYSRLPYTREENAINLTSLILEMSFTDYNHDNIEWLDKIENGNDAMMIFFWVVLRQYYWDNIGLKRQLIMYQFIYDYYKRLFFLLYQDKEYTIDRQELAKDCFNYIMACDYYHYELIIPLKAIAKAELNGTQKIAKEAYHLLEVINNTIYDRNANEAYSDICSFGHNYKDSSIVSTNDLSLFEIKFMLRFWGGCSYSDIFRKLSLCKHDAETEIKKLISYKKLLVSTNLSLENFIKKISTIAPLYSDLLKNNRQEDSDNKQILKKLWDIISHQTNKAYIAGVIESDFKKDICINEMQVIDFIYKMWEIDAITLYLNTNDYMIDL